MPVFEILKALTLRYYLRHKVRLFLCILGVAIGTAVAAAINVTNQKVIYSFEDTMNTIAGESTLRLDFSVPQSPEILQSLVYIWQYGSFSPLIEMSLMTEHGVVTLYGFDFIGNDQIRSYILRSDSVADENKEETERLIESQNNVEALEQRERRSDQRSPDFSGVFVPEDFPGAQKDSLSIVIEARRSQVPVNGIIETLNGRLPPQNSIFADLSVALPLAGGITAIDVLVPDDQIDNVRYRLENDFPGSDVYTMGEKQEITSDMLSAFQMNLTALGVIALLVSAYLVYNTINISVTQRRSQIAALLSLGAKRIHIVQAMLLEGLFLGIPGAIAGIIIGLMLSSFAYGEVSLTVSTIFQLPDGQTDRIAIRAILLTFIAGILAALLASIVPARRAAQSLPVQLIKKNYSEYNPRRNKVFVVLFLLAIIGFTMSVSAAHMYETPLPGFLAVFFVILALSFLAPLAVALISGLMYRFLSQGTILLATSGIRQHAGKVSVAVMALAVALSMAGSVTVMVNSFRTTVVAWMETTVVADLYISPASEERSLVGTVPDNVIDLVEQEPYVRGVLSLMRVRIAYNETYIDVGSHDLRKYHKFSGLSFTEGSHDDILRAAEKNGVLISEVFANSHGYSAGDELNIRGVTFPVLAVFRNFTSERGFVLMDDSTFAGLLGNRQPAGISVYLEEGENAEQAMLSLRQNLSEYELNISISKEIRRQAMQIFDQTFRMTQILQVIAFGIASLSVVTTLLSMILDRKQELALLQACGVSNQKIGLAFIFESLQLAAAGLMAATGGALLLSYLLIAVINRYSFGWTIVTDIPVAVLVYAAGIVLGLAALSAYFPMRLLRSQQPASVLREE